MSRGNYLGVVDCEHDVAKKNERYRKDHRSNKKKFTEITITPTAGRLTICLGAKSIY